MEIDSALPSAPSALPPVSAPSTTYKQLQASEQRKTQVAVLCIQSAAVLIILIVIRPSFILRAHDPLMQAQMDPAKMFCIVCAAAAITVALDRLR